MALNIKNDEDRLLREVEPIQAFLAQLLDRDVRDADEILGYDQHGLPG